MVEPSSARGGGNGTPIAPASRRRGKDRIAQYQTSSRPSTTAPRARAPEGGEGGGWTGGRAAGEDAGLHARRAPAGQPARHRADAVERVRRAGPIAQEERPVDEVDAPVHDHRGQQEIVEITDQR